MTILQGNLPNDFEDFTVTSNENEPVPAEKSVVEGESSTEETAVPTAEEQAPELDVENDVVEPTGEAEQPAEEKEPDTASQPEPETESVADEQPVAEESVDVAALLAEIAALKAQNELLMQKFDEKIKADEHKNQLFDKMYDELAAYKKDMYAKILKPFVLSTVSLLDDTNGVLAKAGEMDAIRLEKYLRNIPFDLIDILESNGVEIYEEPGDEFNPRTQRAMKKVVTSDPANDNKVARRLRKGYRWNDINLKPEMVEVYKYEAPAQS